MCVRRGKEEIFCRQKFRSLYIPITSIHRLYIYILILKSENACNEFYYANQKRCCVFEELKREVYGVHTFPLPPPSAQRMYNIL